MVRQKHCTGRTVLVDEEELYAQDNTMLMRRAFAALTTADDLEKEIPVTESMLAQNIGSTVLDKLQNSLQRVQYYKPTDSTAAHIQQQTLPLIMAHWF